MHWNTLPGLFSISLGIPLVLAAWVDNFTHSLLLLSLTIWYLTSFAHPHLCPLCSWYKKRPFWLLMFAKVHEPQSSVLGIKVDERVGYLLGNTFLLLWPLMLKELNTGRQGICSQFKISFSQYLTSSSWFFFFSRPVFLGKKERNVGFSSYCFTVAPTQNQLYPTMKNFLVTSSCFCRIAEI